MSGLPVESARVSVVFPIMGKTHSVKREVTDVHFMLDAMTRGRRLSCARLTCAALPNPALLRGRAPDTVDFMHPHFAKVKFFALDCTAPHLLPSGCTPCKWHGFADNPDTGVTCSCRDLFCNNFVRQFEDVDGSVGFLFSIRHHCSRLKPEKFRREQCRNRRH